MLQVLISSGSSVITPNQNHSYIGEGLLEIQPYQFTWATGSLSSEASVYNPNVVCGGGIGLSGRSITTTTTGYVQVDTTWRTNVVGNKLRLSCDLPGIKADDVDAKIENGSLTVRARRYDTHEEQFRSIGIDNNYDFDSVQGVLLDGIITFTFDKRPEYVTRKIVVSNG